MIFIFMVIYKTLQLILPRTKVMRITQVKTLHSEKKQLIQQVYLKFGSLPSMLSDYNILKIMSNHRDIDILTIYN